jgi:purine nucleoside phosphorylase
MLYDDIQEAVAYIRSKTDFQPRYGIILGTGLGKLTEEIEVERDIPYRGIPHFPVSTVQSHRDTPLEATPRLKRQFSPVPIDIPVKSTSL